jgi:UPF0716 family protein affecting phage T7 exclusion
MKRWEQMVCIVAALLLIAPGLTVTLMGVAITIPMLMRQLAAWRRVKAGAAPAPA